MPKNKKTAKKAPKAAKTRTTKIATKTKTLPSAAPRKGSAPKIARASDRSQKSPKSAKKTAAPRSTKASADPSPPRSAGGSKRRLRQKLQTTIDPRLLARIDRACARAKMNRSRWFEMVALEHLDADA